MSAHLTRRALFAGAGTVAAVSALAALPSIASARPSRSVWDATVARMEAADGAVSVYSRDVHDPAERAYHAGKRDYPKFECLSDDRYGPPKMLEWSVSTIRRFGQGDAPRTDPLSIYAASQMPLIDAIDDHNKRLLADLRCDEFEAEYERLLEVACTRRDDVFAMAAPDWSALTYKLRLLSKNDHLASETDDDDPLPRIIADAERLLLTKRESHDWRSP